MLPLPTEMVGHYSTADFTVGFSVAAVFLASVPQAVMNLIIRRDPEVASEIDPADLGIVVGPIVTAALLAPAVVVALFVSGVHYFALFLLFLSGPLERIRLRRGA